MASFEERLFTQGKDAQERFCKAAREVFGSPQGKVVLQMLCAAAHPLEHMQVTSAHDHGQCEVVAALWRHGSGDASILAPMSITT